jgi:hypothetical protein
MPFIFKRGEKAKWNLQARGSSESISITANPQIVIRA